MAKSTTAPKASGKGQPTPKAPAKAQANGREPPITPTKANGQAATPPAQETRLTLDGTIERYEHGQLVKSTPPPPANGQATSAKPKAPAAKAQPPPPPAAVPGPKAGESFYVARLGSDDIYEFVPKSAKAGAAVVVRRWKGYDKRSEHTRPAAYAERLYNDLLKKGFVYIDGVTHTLVDEDA